MEIAESEECMFYFNPFSTFTDMHIVKYFASTDVFMSLHKPIITLTPFYEFTMHQCPEHV